jgi:hypothetical protein
LERALYYGVVELSYKLGVISKKASAYPQGIFSDRFFNSSVFIFILASLIASQVLKPTAYRKNPTV